jgi:hypothetical protein
MSYAVEAFPGLRWRQNSGAFRLGADISPRGELAANSSLKKEKTRPERGAPRRDVSLAPSTALKRRCQWNWRAASALRKGLKQVTSRSDKTDGLAVHRRMR